jgi:hypothetical protein
MEIFWLILAAVIILTGLIGAIFPGIPGPVTSFAGLLLCLLSDRFIISSDALLTLGVIAIIITVIDYMIPVYGTKKFGGSRAGMIGSILGLMAGIFFLPGIGIIIGPFVGAFIGEIIAGSQSDKALKAAFGSLIGFMAGAFMKLIYSLVVIYYFVAGLV